MARQRGQKIGYAQYAGEAKEAWKLQHDFALDLGRRQGLVQELVTRTGCDLDMTLPLIVGAGELRPIRGWRAFARHTQSWEYSVCW